jgi:hypothetical protein
VSATGYMRGRMAVAARDLWTGRTQLQPAFEWRALPFMMLGVARVRATEPYRFAFDDGGDEACISPCTDRPPISENPGVTRPHASWEPYDLVAWHPGYPGQWRSLYGAPCWLGWPEVEGPGLRVHRTILGWYRAGMDGWVPLYRRPIELARMLVLAGSVRAEDAAHARELRAALDSLPPRAEVV